MCFRGKLGTKIIGAGAVLFLLVGLLLPTPVFALGVTVSVDAQASVAPGDYFTADINISEVTDFDVGQFEVVFDSSVLNIDDPTPPGVDITHGEIAGTDIPVSVVNPLPGDSDRVRIQVSVPGTSGVTGSGYLCQIRFHAIGAAGTSSTINLENGMLGDKDAHEISVADWSGTTVSVGVPAVLTANAGGPYTGTAGVAVSLSGLATGGVTPYSYAWDLDNDGGYDDSYIQNPSYTWATAGSHTVGLQVTDDASPANMDTDTASVDISAAPAALTANAGGPYSGTAGESVSLSGSATGGAAPYSYAWDLDDDGAYDDSYIQNPSYTWAAAGDYTVGLEVTDDVGDTDTDTASVDISAVASPAPGVGGTAYPPDKLAILWPWIAVLAVILAGGITWLVVRRRRASG